jgi:transcriptional regulator with XRE-family HTH domain
MHSGKTLRLLRQYKGKTQKELGDSIGKSQEMISHWEKQEHLNGEILKLLIKGLESNREEWEKFRRLPPIKIVSSFLPTHLKISPPLRWRDEKSLLSGRMNSLYFRDQQETELQNPFPINFKIIT